MTLLDLSVLPPRRRRRVIEPFQREVVAELALAMYPAARDEHGSANACAEIARQLVEDGHPAGIATERFVQEVVRGGR